MSQSPDLFFAIMNGQCHITDESISFTYDRVWTWLERVFGKPSWRRSLVLAFVLGAPSIGLGLASIALGFWHLVTFLLLIGIVAIFAPFLMLFSEQYTYPESISLCDIRDVTCKQPTTGKLGSFIITFLSDGTLCKTSFCLPTGNYSERVEAFQNVCEAFVKTGLMSDPALRPSA